MTYAIMEGGFRTFGIVEWIVFLVAVCAIVAIAWVVMTVDHYDLLDRRRLLCSDRGDTTHCQHVINVLD